jgi:iron complex transport system substrate-binding protein
VGDLPVVTASRVDTSTLSSRDIDTAVRDAVLSGRALYAVDEALIRELAPDIVITQDLCHVCAVSGDEVGKITSLDAEVISLDPRTIADVEATVLLLGERLDAAAAAGAVVERMRRTIAAAAEAVAGLPPVLAFVAEWLDPPFAAGHWVPEMVTLAGGHEVLGRAGGPSFPVTWDDVSAAGPDVVVVAPCGFGAERAAAESARVRFPCRAVAVEADSYYSRPAPRLADGVAQLAHILHPTVAPDPGLPEIGLAAAVA